MDISTTQQLLASSAFHRLVVGRWRVSLALTFCLFVLYYGYILLIAMNRSIVTARLAETIPLGIPLGAGVIVGSWMLTAAYVVWANRRYDPEVERLRNTLGPAGRR
jgi:uncharacterized membrane protein (DUF485 family)